MGDEAARMVAVHSREAQERELARIADCAQNLREWQNAGNGCAVCIDRRAVVMVGDGGTNGGCLVTVAGVGWVDLLDSYADVVAWWRGGR